MISQTARYALRILGYLAQHPGEFIQGDQIAAEIGVPANYLSKILNQLRKRGFVLSQKGWGGGFLLRMGKAKVPIAEIVELFDGKRDGSQCVFGQAKCNEQNPCPLHHYWEPISRSYEEMLRSVSITDLYVPERRRRA